MGAPLNIEQIILNHNIGVNLSDAGTLDGHEADEFSMVGHDHSVDDITSGVFPTERLPIGTATSKGIVSLTTSTNSTDSTIAAAASAVRAVKQLAESKADEDHSHDFAQLSGSLFPRVMQTKSPSDQGLNIRNISFATSKPSNSYGNDGDVVLVYK